MKNMIRGGADVDLPTLNGGETSLHYSHIKNLDSTIRTLVLECCDKKIKAL